MRFPVAKKFIAATVINMCNPVNAKTSSFEKTSHDSEAQGQTKTLELTEDIKELKGAMSLRENIHCGYEIICQNSSLATLISPS